jgi:hypothetical protein
MRLPWQLCLVFCLGFFGCGKKPTPPEPAVVPSAPAAVSIQAENAPPPPPPVSSPDGTPAPEAPQGPREVPMDVESLNTILGNYIVATDKVPKSFEEMVKLKLIPRVPTPPPGKKYVIDPVSLKVEVRNK